MVSTGAARLEEDISIIFDDPLSSKMVECAEKGESYQEVLSFVLRSTTFEEIRKLRRDCAARHFLYFWDITGVAQRGSENCLAVDGNKVVIFLQARKQVLNPLHKGHMGINRTFWSCRSHYFWVGMKEKNKQDDQEMPRIHLIFPRKKVGSIQKDFPRS